MLSRSSPGPASPPQTVPRTMGDDIDDYDELVDTIIDIGFPVEPSRAELMKWIADGQKSQGYVALCNFCAQELLGHDVASPFYQNLGKALGQLDCRVDTRQLVQDQAARMMVLEYLCVEVQALRITETKMLDSGAAPSAAPPGPAAGGPTNSAIDECLGALVLALGLRQSAKANGVARRACARSRCCPRSNPPETTAPNVPLPEDCPLEPPFCLRAALKYSPQGPRTAHCHQLPNANRHQPPTAHRQPPPTANHQPPTANRGQLPTFVQQCFRGLVSCLCLDNEAESFCWRYEPISFLFFASGQPCFPGANSVHCPVAYGIGPLGGGDARTTGVLDGDGQAICKQTEAGKAGAPCSTGAMVAPIAWSSVWKAKGEGVGDRHPARGLLSPV